MAPRGFRLHEPRPRRTGQRRRVSLFGSALPGLASVAYSLIQAIPNNSPSFLISFNLSTIRLKDSISCPISFLPVTSMVWLKSPSLILFVNRTRSFIGLTSTRDSKKLPKTIKTRASEIMVIRRISWILTDLSLNPTWGFPFGCRRRSFLDSTRANTPSFSCNGSKESSRFLDLSTQLTCLDSFPQQRIGG